MVKSVAIRLSLLFIVVIGCMAHAEKKPGDIVLPYSFAKDSFLIHIDDLAINAVANDTIHIVYYSDGTLKSGKHMQEMIGQHRDGLLKKNYVFVGVGHFGYFRSKRRRDFISPSVKTETGYKGVSADYGQADHFYSFLKEGIIPLVEKKYAGHPISRSFIGHSLGGLFACYLLVNGDMLFDNLYALSPSLWIDDYHLLDYEREQVERLKSVKKNVWISCGSRETLNHIKDGVRRIEDTLGIRKYPDVNYRVKVYEGESHNSAVGVELEDIFSEIRGIVTSK